MKHNRRAWLLTIPLLLLALLLMLQVLWVTHMHPDETLPYVFTRFDAGYAVNYLATQDIQAPLWLAFFWFWRHTLVGDTEFAARLQAVLFSMITLALTYRIGRDWFGKARFGLFAVIALSLSVYFVDYALEIRPYGLSMMLAAASMWLFARWLKRGTWRLALAYGIVTALMFYTHYFLIFLLGVQMLYFLWQVRSRHLFMQAMGAGALAFALWFPWVPSFLGQLRLLREIVQEAGNGYGLGVGTPSTTQPTNLETITRLVSVATNGQWLLYALVLMLGVFLLWRSRRYVLVLLWGLGVPAISLTLNLLLEVYTPRYVAYLVIGLALALGVSLAALRKAAVRNLAIAGFVALNLWAIPGALPVRVPYRDLYLSAAISSQPGDVVFNTPAERADQFIEWQQTHYLPSNLRITTDFDAAQAARRVWFMTGDWFTPQVQVQFAALEPTHPVQKVIGQCDRAWCYLVQLMEAPPLEAPERFGSNVDFWGVDVDSVTRESVSTRLWWRVEETPSLNYSISLRVVDTNGGIVAQHDGPINHYGAEIFETSQLQPGKIYIDWRTVELPPDLPAGTYTLELVVYQSWDGQRLLLDDETDALVLTTLTIS